jgi:hypothetical protein
LTISIALIPMKPYIIRKEIEWTWMWLLFHHSIFKG